MSSDPQLKMPVADSIKLPDGGTVSIVQEIRGNEVQLALTYHGQEIQVLLSKRNPEQMVVFNSDSWNIHVMVLRLNNSDGNLGFSHRLLYLTNSDTDSFDIVVGRHTHVFRAWNGLPIEIERGNDDEVTITFLLTKYVVTVRAGHTSHSDGCTTLMTHFDTNNDRLVMQSHNEI